MEKVSNAKNDIMQDPSTLKLKGKELKQHQSKVLYVLLDIDFESLKIIPLMNEVIKLVQLVWNTEVSFLLEKDSALHHKFRENLHQLISSVEKKIQEQVHNILFLILQIFKEIIEQRQIKSDFVPKEDEKAIASMSVNTATDACAAGIIFLKKQTTRLKDFLNGENRKLVLIELGIAIRNVLYRHYGKYTYNMTGALRLQWDIAEYQNFFMSEVESVDVNNAYTSFKDIANVCVLKPHCLKDHIQNSDKNKCTIQHYMEYLKARSDYRQIHGQIEEQLGLKKVDVVKKVND